ncbi:uncharacterized protein LOC141564515 [Sminthopsis crassicaudata]|uniref:uncharacterized protein LOC141564515 n=1 Tax=Sminthopsis crassicaudata TaxID=9301 RepID=UPI003D692E83
MGVRRRTISATNDQVSNFSRSMEDQRGRHSHDISAHHSFPMPSYLSMPSFRHQSELSHVPYGQGMAPSYLRNFSSGIPRPSHFPHVEPFFQRPPQGAEASNPPRILPRFWVLPRRHRFIECNGEMCFHSRNLEPRRFQPSFPRATRQKKDISGTKYDCYASPSPMLQFEGACNLDSRHDAPPIFHIPLKPETPKHKQPPLMHQNFPPPPTLKYELTPPSSLTDPEEDSMENLFKLLQADPSPKRPRCFVEEIDSDAETTSSISLEHHPEEHSKPLFLDHLHHMTPQEGMKKDVYQTPECDSSSSTEYDSSSSTEYDSSSSTEENSDYVIIDVETIEN